VAAAPGPGRSLFALASALVLGGPVRSSTAGLRLRTRPDRQLPPLRWSPACPALSAPRDVRPLGRRRCPARHRGGAWRVTPTRPATLYLASKDVPCCLSSGRRALSTNSPIHSSCPTPYPSFATFRLSTRPLARRRAWRPLVRLLAAWAGLIDVRRGRFRRNRPVGPAVSRLGSAVRETRPPALTRCTSGTVDAHLVRTHRPVAITGHYLGRARTCCPFSAALLPRHPAGPDRTISVVGARRWPPQIGDLVGLPRMPTWPTLSANGPPSPLLPTPRPAGRADPAHRVPRGADAWAGIGCCSILLAALTEGGRLAHRAWHVDSVAGHPRGAAWVGVVRAVLGR